MKTPRGLQPLLDDGVIDEVLHRLQSGKEAEIFVIRRGYTVCCAKVYKDVDHRGFHRLAEYQEGRRARGSRDARAMNRRSKRGNKVQESQWKNAEVSALYRLAEAGVRVPEPMGVFDGVLLMERVGEASCRLCCRAPPGRGSGRHGPWLVASAMSSPVVLQYGLDF
ncbi:MAG: hypothetical protein NXI11_04325, partial [Proteobacteria bacterium]|nr:hypothetical protein [Pseudomonadota bacterium]